MELSANLSPTIALVGILSGIFLFALSLLLFHILLQRRKAKAARSRLGPHLAHHAGSAHNNNNQRASSASAFSFSSRRRSRSRTSRSDSESDAEGEEEEKMNDRGGSRASSLYLEPNQPLYVDVDIDVESESDDRSPHAGMQFILTPPTPGR